MRINNISKEYNLDRLYYGLDNHNIFKRKDRYKYKKILIAFFGVLVAFNLFEIVFDIVMLNIEKQTEDFNDLQRLITAIISLINVLATFILSSLTINKRKIQSYVYY